MREIYLLSFKERGLEVKTYLMILISVLSLHANAATVNVTNGFVTSVDGLSLTGGSYNAIITITDYNNLFNNVAANPTQRLLLGDVGGLTSESSVAFSQIMDALGSTYSVGAGFGDRFWVARDGITGYSVNAYKDGSDSLGIDWISSQLVMKSLTLPWVTFEKNLAPIPLPTAVWLFGSALLGLGALKRKKA